MSSIKCQVANLVSYTCSYALQGELLRGRGSASSKQVRGPQHMLTIANVNQDTETICTEIGQK